jgi:hypothetical protein
MVSGGGLAEIGQLGVLRVSSEGVIERGSVER